MTFKQTINIVPKELLLEMLFELGMQAQSQRTTLSEGIGYFNSSDLDKAIKKNKERKEMIINKIVLN